MDPCSVVLNVGRLQAGDILLSRPNGWESWLIARLIGSRFSHAEIVVGERITDDGLVLMAYEATTDESSLGNIVGLVRRRRLVDYQFTAKELPDDASAAAKKAYVEAGIRWPVLAMDITRYAEFEVLRPRAVAASAFKRFQGDLMDICNAFHLRPYANADVLGNLVPFPRLLKYLGHLTKRIPRDVHEGLFCSQLVALAYEIGGLRISQLQPREITPRHLAELAEGAEASFELVPRKALQFSPGADYVLANDWRLENELLKRHSTDTAEGLRASEHIQDIAKRAIEFLERMRSRKG
jgi:hypothetical protein